MSPKAPMKKTSKRAAATKVAAKSSKVAAKSSKVAAKSSKVAAKSSKVAAKSSASKASSPKKPRVYAIPFASVYPLYIQKVEKKGRTKSELDEVIAWLTGYRGERLQRVLDTKVDLDTFFAQAPRMNPNAHLITGVVCGMRVEDIADPLMQRVRYLDKLVDELARGKKMASILRA